MKCSNCGAELRDNIHFCTACGNKIEIINNKQKLSFAHWKMWFGIVIVAIFAMILFVIFRPNQLEKSVLDGVWYEYSVQDVFANEWIFYDDGTCTREMRIEGGSNKSDIEYATYSIDENKIIIYIDDMRVEWEYDLKQNCCWLYFGDEYGSYKLKILHYEQKLTQTELDKSFSEVSDYIVAINEEDLDNKSKQDSKNNIENPVDLVKIWDNFSNMGFCCSTIDAPSNIYEHLTDYQKQWVFEVYESTCCHTLNEAKSHINHYIDSSLTKDFDERNFLEYNGKLYIVTGAMGYVEHNYAMSTWYEKSNGNIAVYSERLNSGGERDGEDEFIIEEKEGTYRIVGVKDNTVDLSKYY